MDKKAKNKIVTNIWNFGGLLGLQPTRVIITLIKWIIILTVISSLLNMASNQLTENKDVYTTCVESCKVPGMTGHTLKAFDKEFTSIDPTQILGVPSCIESCNDMYMVLRGVN